jgi:hypothetical protein
MSELINTAGAIAAEIKRRLQTILQANGFETNIGRDVMMGRRRIPGDDRPPCLMVAEAPDNVEDRPGRVPQVLVQAMYVIDGFDACDPDNPNDKAHAMIRDIKRAIFADGTTLGAAVKKCDYLGRDIGPHPDGVALVQARVNIGVTYVETLAQP